TWSDYPGTIGATKALVNDLDLEVTAPDGTVYRGNHFAPFAQGQSLPGGTFDTTNVEEAVILKNAMAGNWSVRVIGSNVPVGQQPFALVATGNLDASYGRLTLDRIVYSEEDTIHISVDDSDATSVVAHVASRTEPAGEKDCPPWGECGHGWQCGDDTLSENSSILPTTQTRQLRPLHPQPPHPLGATPPGRLTKDTTDTNDGADYQFNRKSTRLNSGQVS